MKGGDNMPRHHNSNNQETATNIKENLMHQVDKILQQTNEKSIKTRYRYLEATERFCDFLANKYHLQKFANVKPKHLLNYVEYLQQNYSPSSVKTDISGIRFFHAHSGSDNILPDNKRLNLEKRQSGVFDRAWTLQEIQSAINIAGGMGRTDIVYAIKMAYTYGMRIEEVCRCQVNHLKNAVKTGDLYIKGKNGQVRYLRITSRDQSNIIKELLAYASYNKRSGTDRVLIDNIKGATLSEKKSIQNWIINHRGDFQDNSRTNTEKQKQIQERAKQQGIKMKIGTVTFHGLRHFYAQERYKYYVQKGYSRNKSLRSVAEELGHHRSSVTKVYLSVILS
jgi:integrase